MFIQNFSCPKCLKQIPRATEKQIKIHLIGCGLKEKKDRSGSARPVQGCGEAVPTDDALLLKSNSSKAVRKVYRQKEIEKLIPKSKEQLIEFILGHRAQIVLLSVELNLQLKKQKEELDKKEEYSQKYKDRKTFYGSRAWRALRYQVLKEYGRICALCRTTEGEMHVDHIKPRERYPELELTYENLQILCKNCNLGKSNQDETDFRPKKYILRKAP